MAVAGGRPSGAAVARRVVGDDPEVPREVRDLRLPDPAVEELPGRQEEHGRSPLPCSSQSTAAVRLDEALAIRYVARMP